MLYSSNTGQTNAICGYSSSPPIKQLKHENHMKFIGISENQGNHWNVCLEFSANVSPQPGKVGNRRQLFTIYLPLSIFEYFFGPLFVKDSLGFALIWIF